MKIPYGISDFGQIREGGFFYADKTPFLPVLEAGYRPWDGAPSKPEKKKPARRA